jgi:hypothetical protein
MQGIDKPLAHQMRALGRLRDTARQHFARRAHRSRANRGDGWSKENIRIDMQSGLGCGIGRTGDHTDIRNKPTRVGDHDRSETGPRCADGLRLRYDGDEHSMGTTVPHGAAAGAIGPARTGGGTANAEQCSLLPEADRDKRQPSRPFSRRR